VVAQRIESNCQNEACARGYLIWFNW
jgi:hypothetical protein